MAKLAFVHPDLGIGGAEQLVVNLCLAGKRHGYEPHIYTPYHHKSFPQTHDGTILVHQHGSFFGLLPSMVLGRFKAVLSYLRSLICVLWLIIYDDNDYAAVVVDQVSIVMPLLHLAGYRTIFYCHYPDKLLSGSRGLLKRFYRFLLDLLEEVSLLFAHKIYVNSEYTRTVFRNSFPLLRRCQVQVQVLYPSIDLQQFDLQLIHCSESLAISKELTKKYFLSLNRYERKKNIELALTAFTQMLQQHPQADVDLVIAGGYDQNIAENIQYLCELQELTLTLSIGHRVHFYTSVSDQTRKYLLRNAECVLYTPKNEHFGIVPCEAMYSGVPVIADNSGGPKESVGDGCGYLCDTREQWAAAMWNILNGAKYTLKHGRDRVIQKFSFDSFGKQFVTGVQSLVRSKDHVT